MHELKLVHYLVMQGDKLLYNFYLSLSLHRLPCRSIPTLLYYFRSGEGEVNSDTNNLETQTEIKKSKKKKEKAGPDPNQKPVNIMQNVLFGVENNPEILFTVLKAN